MLETATRTIVVIRYRSGVVGESRRVSHLIVLEDQEFLPDHVTTLCGTQIMQGEADALDHISGMPCELCIVRS
ncbi:MAG TPA: hypothetical protein VGP03_01840 [Pseudonocardiaceae bacterium]|jgi:hypothetical protein|nr:hypothetical protein [Pseudonocardiaceae bacterium]